MTSNLGSDRIQELAGEERYSEMKAQVMSVVSQHFRPEFIQRLRQYADDHGCLLLYDEVQTGFFGSGKPWMWQHLGVAPDIVAFGKKSQVGGVSKRGRVHVASEAARRGGGGHWRRGRVEQRCARHRSLRPEHD